MSFGYINNENSVDKDQQSWLDANGLGDNQRLTQILQVDAGWESAVEVVLAPILNSICVESCVTHRELLSGNESLSLYMSKTTRSAKPGTLAACAKSDCVPSELNSIYTADDSTQAWAMLDKLGDNDSVITKDCLWISKNWARAFNLDSDNVNSSQILCAKEIKELESKLPEYEESINALQLDLEQATAKVKELEAAGKAFISRGGGGGDQLV